MKVKILIIAFLCAQFIGFSQKRKVERLERDKTPSLRLGYASRINFKNPGVNIGAEFMMRRKTVTKRNVRTKEKFLVAKLSFFDEPNLYNNASLTAEWLKRTRYGSGGFFTEASVGFGVGRIIKYVITPTYIRNPDGTESIKKPKNDFILLSFNAGLGYDFMPKMQKPIKTFARLSYNPIYYNAWPYSLYLKPEIGVIASLSAFKKK
jgi:hypothetical protein